MVSPILKSSLAKVASTGKLTTLLGEAERATRTAYGIKKCKFDQCNENVNLI